MRLSSCGNDDMAEYHIISHVVASMLKKSALSRFAEDFFMEES